MTMRLTRGTDGTAEQKQMLEACFEAIEKLLAGRRFTGRVIVELVAGECETLATTREDVVLR